MAYKGHEGCYDRAGEDEPIFTLRAQDVLAPLLVETWAKMARLLGAPVHKVAEALFCASEMREWQQKNHSKVPD